MIGSGQRQTDEVENRGNGTERTCVVSCRVSSVRKGLKLRSWLLCLCRRTALRSSGKRPPWLAEVGCGRATCWGRRSLRRRWPYSVLEHPARSENWPCFKLFFAVKAIARSSVGRYYVGTTAVNGTDTYIDS